MRKWYVIYTKPRQETVASRHLQHKGIDSFLPMICDPWKRKIKTIEPLFPSYLFARISFPEEYQLALWTPGTKRFVSFGAEPAPIDDQTIEFLMEKSAKTGTIEVRSTLRPGDQVTISSGPFEGLAGIIESPPDRRGRVRILMNLLKEQAPVKVPAWLVKGTRMVELSPSFS